MKEGECGEGKKWKTEREKRMDEEEKNRCALLRLIVNQTPTVREQTKIAKLWATAHFSLTIINLSSQCTPFHGRFHTHTHILCIFLFFPALSLYFVHPISFIMLEFSCLRSYHMIFRKESFIWWWNGNIFVGTQSNPVTLWNDLPCRIYGI